MVFSDTGDSQHAIGKKELRSLNAKAIRKEAERIQKKTFNGIVKMNERISAGDKLITENQSLNLDSLRQRMLSSTKLLELVANKSIITDNGAVDIILEILRDIGVDPSSVRIGTVRSAKMTKNAPSHPRLPYVSYLSSDGIIIRVGRSASDNDELSCNRLHRDDADWWLHVHGFSGSHVVIRSNDDELPIKFPSTLREAATLAAIQSKCPDSRAACEVTYTRCRHVTKDKSDPPGLVRLNASVTGIIKVKKQSSNAKFEETLRSKSYSESSFNILKQH
jgi:hypothetical protein